MILQELCELYDRLEHEEGYLIPPPGFCLKKISFSIVLNPDGTLFDINDERIRDGKKMIPKTLIIPGREKLPRATPPDPQILCDSAEYSLGFNTKGNEDDARAEERFAAFRELHLALSERLPLPQVQAVCNFLKNWNVQSLSESQKEILRETGSGVFKIVGEERFIHKIPEIEKAIVDHLAEEATESSTVFCLVSGKEGKLARIHAPKIKNVVGQQSSGAALVSYDKSSFESFGKEQGANAPVAEESAQKYCKALNALLSSDKHRLRLGGSTVVFWTKEKTQTEDLFATYFDPPKRDEKNPDSQDNARLQQLKTFLEALRDAGTVQSAFDQLQNRDSTGTPFFMLGLSGNAGRISVRFWHAGTLGGFLEKLKAHHAAMRIQKAFPNETDFISVWQILAETVRDAKDISPVLGGELMRAILEGTNYPATLLPAILRRIAVSSSNEKKKYKCGTKVSYRQASIIKAILVKNYKLIESEKMETIDLQNENVAYRLGRLFAVIEKAQSDSADRDVNAGIGDKYFSSASSTPSVVFPTLIDLHQKHLSKLGKARKGAAVNFKKLVREIVSTIKTFPKTLSIEERGLFAIGYYHQMRDLFTKKSDTDGNATNSEPVPSENE